MLDNSKVGWWQDSWKILVIKFTQRWAGDKIPEKAWSLNWLKRMCEKSYCYTCKFICECPTIVAFYFNSCKLLQDSVAVAYSRWKVQWSWASILVEHPIKDIFNLNKVFISCFFCFLHIKMSSFYTFLSTRPCGTPPHLPPPPTWVSSIQSRSWAQASPHHVQQVS